MTLDSSKREFTENLRRDLERKLVVLTPEPKRPGLFELNKSIHLSGKLPKPQRSLVDRLTPLAGAGCEDGKP